MSWHSTVSPEKASCPKAAAGKSAVCPPDQTGRGDTDSAGCGWVKVRIVALPAPAPNGEEGDEEAAGRKKNGGFAVL